jgi:hypothetical protein
MKNYKTILMTFVAAGAMGSAQDFDSSQWQEQIEAAKKALKDADVRILGDIDIAKQKLREINWDDLSMKLKSLPELKSFNFDFGDLEAWAQVAPPAPPAAPEPFAAPTPRAAPMAVRVRSSGSGGAREGTRDGGSRAGARGERARAGVRGPNVGILPLRHEFGGRAAV